ncbi:unnamed protein product, partial [Notodromas monacha]
YYADGLLEGITVQARQSSSFNSKAFPDVLLETVPLPGPPLPERRSLINVPLVDPAIWDTCRTGASLQESQKLPESKLEWTKKEDLRRLHFFAEHVDDVEDFRCLKLVFVVTLQGF